MKRALVLGLLCSCPGVVPGQGGPVDDAGCSPAEDAGVAVVPDAGEPIAAPEVPADFFPTSEDLGAPLPNSPFRIAGLSAPLSSLDPALVRRALDHIRLVANAFPEGAVWKTASLYNQAVPLQRPDLTGPAYVELKLEAAGKNAGWLVLSTGQHDAPVVAFRTDGPAPSELLAEQAALAGRTIARIFRLDTVYSVAEDATGTVVAASHDTVLVPQPSDAGFAGAPLELAPGPRSAWPAAKVDYGIASERIHQVERTGQASMWAADQARADVRSMIDISLVTGPTAPPLVPLNNFTTVEDDGDSQIFCENNWARSPFWSKVDDLTPIWDQITGDFSHVPKALPTCASGCTPMAAAIIFGWMDLQGQWGRGGPWSRPDLTRAFFRYTSKLDPLTLASDPGPAAYDYTAKPFWSWSSIGQSMVEGSTPSIAMDMRRYLTELSWANGTGCSGTEGNTYWPNINGLQRFIDRHRLPITMHTGSNPFGESGFRDAVIQRLRDTGAPGFIHTGGWSGHTEVVNAHVKCWKAKKGTLQHTWDGDHFFYLNAGWGRKTANRWVPIGNLMMSTVFDPSAISVLRVSHTRLPIAPGGVVNGAPSVEQHADVIFPFNNWYAIGSNGDGSFWLRSAANGLCLAELPGPDFDGAPVGHVACNGSGSQSWYFIGQTGGTFRLRPKNSSRCLSVAGASTADRAQLDLSTCTGVAHQSFDVAPR